MMNRRTLLATLPCFAAHAAFAGEKPLSDFDAAALERYEAASGGRVGAFAENIATGKRIAWRADDRFVMCSTFKASLAAMMLARVDRGEDRLDAMIAYGKADIEEYAPVAKDNLPKGAMSVADMCKAAVELSDNTCANLLLARGGGPKALTAFWRSSGDGVSRLDHNEPELNRTPPGGLEDTTTPAAMAGTLRRFVLGEMLTPASRDRLTAWLVNCQTGANRLRAGLPDDWRVGDKSGNNGKDGFGDIAITWPKPDRPVVIAVYTRGGAPKAADVADVFRQFALQAAQRLA